MQRNQDPPRAYPGDYSTDLVTTASLNFLDEAIPEGKPFFVRVAPIGPHSETINGQFNPTIPADRHKDFFPGLKVSRTDNFNPDTTSGASWIKTLQKLNQTVVDYLDEIYRLRVLSLQAVDELVDSIVRHLEKSLAVLENTYIIYTTDNGFHAGQHRLAPRKTSPFEEGLNIPFIIRGPGVEKGKTASVRTSHVDIAPTIFELAGIPLQGDFDGLPMPVTKAQQEAVKAYKTEHANIEFGEGAFLRVDFQEMALELSTLKSDPGQMVNLYDTSNRGSSSIYGWEAQKLISRLDAFLLTLKTCKGASCCRPWSTLHPKGDVLSFEQAMNPKFDKYYAEDQNKVSFSVCVGGFITEYEGGDGAEAIPRRALRHTSPGSTGGLDVTGPQEHTRTALCWLGPLVILHIPRCAEPEADVTQPPIMSKEQTTIRGKYSAGLGVQVTLQLRHAPLKAPPFAGGYLRR
ncbi:hypothetical protein DL764_002785 [Monosporascus ibericus]|uniref:Sulfatase N-terminal domain-containing protein n=1 Tax=Monosporascus ibericus TaxID=155417 RepID=A0A4Q4TJ30_9PEZI|nr:hypothetical protein DL764_002785 [Monosporascus ibericus]